MTITVKQHCDGCNASRFLTVVATHGREVTVGVTTVDGGWREVKPGLHLCPVCISKALKK